MNNVNLAGRLAKDPIARDHGDTRITEITLVTERHRIRDGKVQKDPDTGYPLKDAEFHKVTIFNGMGMGVRDHKVKGDLLAVIGYIHSRWTDGSGQRGPFLRNKNLIKLRPVEAIVCEGSGIQSNLAQRLRQAGVPIHIRRLSDQRAAQRLQRA